jgi:Fe2+ transport system protein B
VFSALVLRTDEHELLRLMLAPFRLCLVASTVAALFATAVLGFRADAWVLDAGWALAAFVSAVAATILIREAVRAPSMGAPAER